MGNHSNWRKLAKKARRKRIRRKLALIKEEEELKERHRQEASPSYQKWLQEQQDSEELQREEEERKSREANEKYLETERLAQIKWKELQEKLKLIREERHRQDEKIKLEWQAEQEKIRKLKEEKERLLEEKRQQEIRLQEEINEYVKSNGPMPAQLQENRHSNPGKPVCHFFSKLAACRFGDSCSRDHIRPTTSRTILIKNFYSHYSLNSVENEHGDSSLEFETSEIYDHFKEFFDDVLPELEKCGTVQQFKVCCNKEVHLRGNVYVEYSSRREAIRSFRQFHGRFYGGKQLTVEFCTVASWKSAICGLFFRKRCPKGSVCNFLHVFRNPDDAFKEADRDMHRSPREKDYENDSRNWRWSESPEMDVFRSVDDDKCPRRRRWSREREYSRKRPHRRRTKSRSSSRNSSRRHKRTRSKSRSSSRRRHRS